MMYQPRQRHYRGVKAVVLFLYKHQAFGMAEKFENNSMQLTQNSQSNVHNVLTNLTNSPTLNFLANAEFKDCQININIMKNKSP